MVLLQVSMEVPRTGKAEVRRRGREELEIAKPLTFSFRI